MFRGKSSSGRNRREESPGLITPENPMSLLLGSKVIIRTQDGDYQGIVKHVWGDAEKLSLAKVVAIPSEKTFIGVLNFFKQEIIDIKIVEPRGNEVHKDAKAGIKNNVPPKPLPLLDMDSENHPSGYVDCDEDDVDVDEGTAEVPRISADDAAIYSKVGDIKWEEDIKMVGEYKFYLPVPRIYTIIDEINKDFQESVADIKSCSFVGLAAECSKGRFGEIIMLCIGTKSTVYLFDIIILGKEGFERGLRNILESPEITKIIHDCRMLSDALYHLWNVELSNVIDTQVGDVVLYMRNNKGRPPAYVCNLSQCIRKYLQLESKFLPRNHHHELQRNLELWKIRPFPPSCREAAIHSVLFLQELKEAMMEKLLLDLTDGTKIYIDAVKKASKEELALNLGSPHVLPPAMSRLTSQEMELLHHYTILNKNTSYQNIWNNNSDPAANSENKVCSRTVVSESQRKKLGVTSNGRQSGQNGPKHRGLLLDQTANCRPEANNGYCEQGQPFNVSHRSKGSSSNEDTVQAGISELLSEKEYKLSSSDSDFQKDLQKIRLAASCSYLPKNKCIPAGQMTFTSKKSRAPRK